MQLFYWCTPTRTLRSASTTSFDPKKKKTLSAMVDALLTLHRQPYITHCLIISNGLV